MAKRKIRIFKPKKLVEGAGGAEYVKGAEKGKPEEYKVHRPIVRVLRNIQDYTKQLTFFHVPNQLLQKSGMRKIYHGLGVVAGVTDLVIPIGGGVTLWLELKYDKQPLSDDQAEFLKRLRFLGHKTYVIRAKNPDDAVNQIYAILAEHGITDFRMRGPVEWPDVE